MRFSNFLACLAAFTIGALTVSVKHEREMRAMEAQHARDTFDRGYDAATCDLALTRAGMPAR